MRIVVKFGGSSLADAERIYIAAKKIGALHRAGNAVVAVVSAQGDTTDDMIEKAAKIHPNPPKREMDAYFAAGEQMSAALMAMALQKMDLPAVSLTGMQAGIMTDGVHSDARVLGLKGDRVRQELEKGNIVVVAGFQGLNGAGDITTLGRGGSDTTAVALAAFLQAKLCRIYTDVDGVYDRDPRKFPDAVKLPWVSYEKMLQMAQQGAQVLHDRCVELAQLYQVPVQVLSTFRPGEGTFITALRSDFPQS